MAAMDLRFTPAERILGVQWIAANVVGWVIGFAVCEAVKSVLFVLTHFNSDGLVIGAAMGTAQWLVLRRRMAPVRWWVVASIVGFGVGRLLGDAAAQGVSASLGYALSGAILGVSVGLAQWLILRRHAAQAGWWVPACGLAWAVGWSIIGLVEEAAGLPTLTVYVVTSVGAAVVATITGTVLIWLLRTRQAGVVPAS